MKKGLFYTLAALIFAHCTPKTELDTQTAVPPTRFPVTSPVVLDTTYNSEYVADIQSLQNVEIRSRARGFIQTIYTDEGRTVRAGELLFSLNNQDFKQDINKAQAALRQAQAEAKALELEIRNTRSLVDKSVISNTELELAQARLEVLQAKIEEAQSDEATARLGLSYTQIRAPFDGIVGRIPNKVGSLVEEGALLTTLSNNQAVYAYFNVSEREYLDFAQKQNNRQQETVHLLLANGTPYLYPGKIENIDGQFDKSTGNIALRARFPNPQHLLRHGASGRITLPVDLKNALVIPQKSAFEVQDRTCVYVVDETGKVQLRSIVPKLRLAKLFVVESGLNATDRIIYEGIQTVREGEKVDMDFTALPKILAGFSQE